MGPQVEFGQMMSTDPGESGHARTSDASSEPESLWQSELPPSGPPIGVPASQAQVSAAARLAIARNWMVLKNRMMVDWRSLGVRYVSSGS